MSALRLRLGVRGSTGSTRPPTQDIEAYQLFLKGQHNWYKRERGSLEKAASFFEQAVERDPSYVAALAGLATAYASLSVYGTEPTAAARKARSAIERAAALDPHRAEVRAAAGYVSWLCDLDVSRAEAELRQALASNPSDPLAHCWLGFVLVHSGRAEQAIAAIRRAQELDPLSPYVQSGMGHTLLIAGRPQEAVVELEKATSIDADFLLALYALGAAQVILGRHAEGVITLERAVLLAGRGPFYLAWLGWAYARAGRRSDAEALVLELEERSRTEYVAPPFFAAIHAGLDEPDRAFEWLERGCAERNATMSQLRWPLWISLRTDPRYGDLLRRLGQGSWLPSRPA